MRYLICVYFQAPRSVCTHIRLWVGTYLIITAMVFDVFKIKIVSIHNTECIREKISELENSLAKIKTWLHITIEHFTCNYSLLFLN